MDWCLIYSVVMGWAGVVIESHWGEEGWKVEGWEGVAIERWGEGGLEERRWEEEGSEERGWEGVVIDWGVEDSVAVGSVEEGSEGEGLK